MWKILRYRIGKLLANAKIRSVDSGFEQTLATKALCMGVKALCF